MKKEDIKLLQLLHDIIEIDSNFLTNKQYEIYNYLVDKAEIENIIW